MVVPGRFYGFLPSIAPAGGVSGGSQPPGWCLLQHSGTLTLSAPGCRNRSGGWSGHRPGVAPPDPRARIALGVRGTGEAAWFSMRKSGWSGRGAFWVPAPIAFGGGCVGGQPAPRLVSAPAFRNPHALSAWMRKYPRGWNGHRPGVAPPDPRVRLPWKCGGRAGQSGSQ